MELESVVHMKKYLLLVIAMLSVCSLICGCSVMESDDDLADARIKQVFSAIENRDTRLMYSQFSQNAISDNLQTKITDLFAFIEGDMISWSRDESSVVLDTVEYGNRSKQLTTWYRIKTTKEEYLVLLIDYPIDMIEPDNQGLYTLKIIKSADENKLTGKTEDWTLPGIDLPAN